MSWPKRKSKKLPDGSAVEEVDSGMFIQRTLRSSSMKRVRQALAKLSQPDSELLEQVMRGLDAVAGDVTADELVRKDALETLDQANDLAALLKVGDYQSAVRLALRVGAGYERVRIRYSIEPEVQKKRNSADGPTSRKGKSFLFWDWIKKQPDWRKASQKALYARALKKFLNESVPTWPSFASRLRALKRADA
jgi:hypothetical protein